LSESTGWSFLRAVWEVDQVSSHWREEGKSAADSTGVFNNVVGRFEGGAVVTPCRSRCMGGAGAPFL
jgi:hypothetical protein